MRLASICSRGGIGVVLLVVVLLVAFAIASVRLKPDKTLELRIPVRLKPDATLVLKPDIASSLSIDRTLECERRAARMAAWRGQTAGGAPGLEPAWLGHYSSRDDVCYAAVAGNVTVANGEPPPLVTELWNAFEATLLATFTSDRRAEMRRDFCRIDLAENPFTSCLVAEFFVRQHLAN
jgi:hypothetical protein